MAKYSSVFKQGVLAKVLPPQSRSKKEVADEVGISARTIDNWLNQLSDSSNDSSNLSIPPNKKNINEKMTLVFESKTISKSKMGKWLKENGLHSEHISQWELEIREALTSNNKDEEKRLKDLKSKNKSLQKDLDRKDKALAEVAALLTLKKKAQEFWGEEEDE